MPSSDMSVWGIGGKWLFWSLVASTPVIIFALLFRTWLVVDGVHAWAFYGAAVVLLIIGLPFWMISAITLNKNFESEKLCTTGVFGLCRNPIYTAWILFLVPGVLLLFRNPLLLLIPVIMYVVLLIVLPCEEAWLEGRFGEDYVDYKHRVSRILPFGEAFTVKARNRSQSGIK